MRIASMALAALIGVWGHAAVAATAESELLSLYYDANGRCRDSGTEADVNAACAERERISSRLEKLGLCYGRPGQVEAEKGWEKCSSKPSPQRCVVADPTSTPLNYRTRPYGSVLGSLDNGQRVFAQDTSLDNTGKPWVYITDEEGRPLGWVYRNYVVCR